MEIQTNRRKAKIISYAVPPVITVMAMLIIMLIRRMYPFGSGRIGYYDSMHQMIPMYSQIWDVLHGRASLSYSLKAGMGLDLSGVGSSFSVLSPFNLLLYFTPRNYIMEFMSVMLIVKMACMSITMYFYFNHCRTFSGASYVFKVIFAILYAFCGYVLLYSDYCVPWMDFTVLFPILMLSYNKMLDRDRKRFYIVMTAVAFIVNCEFAIMAVMYIIMRSGVYAFFIISRQDTKEQGGFNSCGHYLGNVLIGTAAGIGTAAFAWIPFADSIIGERNISRVSDVIAVYVNILNQRSQSLSPEFFQRCIMLYGTAFAVAMIISGVIRYRREKNNTYYIFSLLAIVLIPLVFSKAGQIWNGIRHSDGSVRFGYIAAFTLLEAACYFIGKPMQRDDASQSEVKFEMRFDALEKLVFLLAGMVVCAMSAYFYNKIQPDTYITALIFLAAVYIMLLIFNMALCLINKGIFTIKCVCISIAMEIFIGLYVLAGVPQFYEDSGGRYYNYASEIRELEDVSGIMPSDTKRVKNPDGSLGDNYSLLLQRPSRMQNFDVSDKDTEMAKLWGYAYTKDKILDAGGTVFIDAVENVTHMISREAADNNLYEKSTEADGLMLYRSRYTIPFGMTIRADGALISDGDTACGWVEYSNYLYKALSGKDVAIAGYIDVNAGAGGSLNEMTIDVTGRRAIYIELSDKLEPSQVLDIFRDGLEVNGQKVYMPDMQRRALEEGGSCGLIYIGCFENEQLVIRFSDYVQNYGSINGESVIRLGTIDMEALAVLNNMISSNTALAMKSSENQSGNIVNMKAERTRDRNMLFIPIPYSNNWNVTINGDDAEVISLCEGTFMGIMLREGENAIKMAYIPNGTDVGLAISVITIMILIGAYSMTRQKRFRASDKLRNAATVVFILLWAVLIILMYIIPIGCQFY